MFTAHALAPGSVAFTVEARGGHAKGLAWQSWSYVDVQFGTKTVAVYARGQQLTAARRRAAVQGNWPPYIHAIAIGDTALSTSAQHQARAYYGAATAWPATRPTKARPSPGSPTRCLRSL